MKKRTIVAALTAGAVVLVATAQQVGPRAPYWPKTTGSSVVQEWYTDIPWHQKLGTFSGNEIDEPLVLPYDALPANEKTFCASKGMKQEDCMLELGVVNILGMLRTDTLYDTTEQKIKDAPECKDPALPCIEVKLEMSSLWTRASGNAIELQQRPFGQDPSPQDKFGGYVITEGSTYAPQMPFYMTHYCDSLFPETSNDVQDPVCYVDYFSPMNNGFSPLPAKRVDEWPRAMPWSVYPPADPPGATNHCKKGETKCTMVMAGFELRDLPSNPKSLQYEKYNGFLMSWFNNALTSFATDFSKAELERHFPWSGTPVTWETFLYPQAIRNPFLGQFDDVTTAPPNGPNCDVTLNGPTTPNCFNTAIVRANKYLYPRQCKPADVATGNFARLRHCALNYELHHNGYYEQWPESFWPDVEAAGIIANQYGRTSFLFAGVPGLQMPVSFYKDPANDSGLDTYQQVNNASIFNMFLPYTNVADTKHAYHGRNYDDTHFYNTLLMSNHMEADPATFADGIRGKVLWHNEYRTEKMYESFRVGKSAKFPTRMFTGAFDASTAKAPFHSNTCDSCHVRNGSGIPINTEGKLDPVQREFMTAEAYNPFPGKNVDGYVKDYTFTGEIRPMKLVFFDLKRDTTRLDGSRYSEPLSFSKSVTDDPPRTMSANDLYYNNKVMNFYGDSFHATTKDYNFAWNYEAVDPARMVVKVARTNVELGKTYQPWQIKLGAFQTSASCRIVQPPPTTKPWPATCADTDDAAIRGAVDGSEVGFMLLNGKRLGNSSAIEAIPNQAILGFRASQAAALGDKIAGEVIFNAGSRDGVNGKVFRMCRTKSLTDCFIGRFGWLGDRASLEDQVANAAFVEMNMTTTEGYNKLYFKDDAPFPIRYNHTNCGPANLSCRQVLGNSDLSERDVERMADYARWLGNPTRSEFKVALPEVVAGEKIFRRLKCDTCHVIRKIDIDPEDTMLTKFYRERLARHVTQSTKPFLTYIGTDLLMHDMGYLSQVGKTSHVIRDGDGVVLPQYQNFVQKVRTPPLKGLQFNRFVTESHRNTKSAGDPACDFLLHDGRACDAIEAAFLHDGPAVKKLGVIEGLNALTQAELKQLRAFLYSL